MQMQSARYGMPNKEVQRSDQVSDVSAQAADSDLAVNNLVYENPDALSLAVSRSSSRLFFQRAQYNPGETAVIDFNSGTDFIDPENSYLAFTLTPIASAATATCSFGIGSAMNAIRQVTIRSRSGVEIDRVERANVWSLFETQYRNPNVWFTSVGAAMEGFNQANYNNLAAAGGMVCSTAATSSTGYRFLLPLKRLAPFFKPIKRGQKIPPQLVSGLHMEIIWENYLMALAQGSGAGTITSYQINNLSLVCDVISMTDDVQKTINQQSADAGLEYAYPRAFTNVVVPGNTTSLSAQVRKAVSQANYAWAVCLNTDNYILIGTDSFKAIAWDTTRYQWRLGALYFPLQPLDVNLTDGVESFKQVLEVYDKNKLVFSPPNVSLAEFATGGKGIIAVALEKDAELDSSGLPVNNSRVLELNATFNAGIAAREVLIFLDYNAVSRSYVDNTSVNI